MCFYNDDYDWMASVQDLKEGPVEKDCRCEDCHAKIAQGEWCRYIYQQEHEQCTRCEHEELGPDDEPCDEHDYGETWHGYFCRACCDFRAAIEAVETDEGCPPNARQPSYGGLWDELYEIVRWDDGRKYLDRAVAMFPDIRERSSIVAELFGVVVEGEEC